MSKISFKAVVVRKEVELPTEFWMCRGDKSMMHTLVDEGWEIDQFITCTTMDKCTACEKYLNRLKFEQAFKNCH